MDTAAASMDDLLAEFLEETSERIVRIESGLSALADTPGDSGLLADIHVLLRTITGTSGFLNLPELESLAQAADTVVERMREGEISLTPEICDLVIVAIDRIKTVLGYLRRHEAEPGHDHRQLIDDLAFLADTGELSGALSDQTVLSGDVLLQDNTMGGGVPASEISEAEEQTPTVTGDTVPVRPRLLQNLMRMVTELVSTRNQLVSLLHDRADSDVEEPLQRLTDLTKDLRHSLLATQPEPLVPALLVRCGEHLFALPQEAVIEIRSEPVTSRSGKAMVLKRGDDLLPLVDAVAVFGLPPSAIDDAEQKTSIIVLENDGHRFGLVVDHVEAVEDVPVQPLAPLLRSVPYYRGAAVLDDGTPVMLLEPATFAPTRSSGVDQDSLPSGSDPSAFLLCRCGDLPALAVPLDRIERLEQVKLTDVQHGENGLSIEYGGKPLPLVPADQEAPFLQKGYRPVLVISEEGRKVGLIVDDVSDIVDSRIALEASTERPGYLGSALLDGQVTEIVDCGYFLEQSGRLTLPAMEGQSVDSRAGKRLLLVDGSAYIRNLLAPVLTAGGYVVTTASTVAEALAFCEKASGADAIVCGLHLPDGSGATLVETLRADARWRGIPVIAVSPRGTGADLQSGLAGGFADCVGMYNRDGLLQALAELL